MGKEGEREGQREAAHTQLLCRHVVMSQRISCSVLHAIHCLDTVMCLDESGTVSPPGEPVDAVFSASCLLLAYML